MIHEASNSTLHYNIPYTPHISSQINPQFSLIYTSILLINNKQTDLLNLHRYQFVPHRINLFRETLDLTPATNKIRKYNQIRRSLSLSTFTFSLPRNTSPMARPKSTRRTLDMYTVKHIGKTIRPGDCVLMRASDSSNPSYVARVEKIEGDTRGANVRLYVRWYYRPEESIGGRRQFHSLKEVFLSDHFDYQSAETIEGKCTVHNFKTYTKLDAVGNEDFFCRFEYNSATGAFNPDRVAVYCKCEMPYNPDDLMIQCDGCTDWFHPHCIDMTPEEAKKVEHFFCHDCSSEEQKKLQNSNGSARHADEKVDVKRRRR